MDAAMPENPLPESPARWLCRLDDLLDGEATALDAELALDGAAAAMESVILLRRGEAVQAWLNICPHAGRRLDWAPGKFLLKDRTLICAVHGASFDTGSGQCIAGPCRGERLRPVAIEVVHGDVRLAG